VPKKAGAATSGVGHYVNQNQPWLTREVYDRCIRGLKNSNRGCKKRVIGGEELDYDEPDARRREREDRSRLQVLADAALSEL
jgi:hypothetical protein